MAATGQRARSAIEAGIDMHQDEDDKPIPFSDKDFFREMRDTEVNIRLWRQRAALLERCVGATITVFGIADAETEAYSDEVNQIIVQSLQLAGAEEIEPGVGQVSMPDAVALLLLALKRMSRVLSIDVERKLNPEIDDDEDDPLII
jgi:hypothetical protein